jgi:hypothetical protein
VFRPWFTQCLDAFGAQTHDQQQFSVDKMCVRLMPQLNAIRRLAAELSNAEVAELLARTTWRFKGNLNGNDLDAFFARGTYCWRR